MENQSKVGTIQDELECEEAIISDKQRFGRVRTSLMKYLRTKYGEKTANKVLTRINQRASNGTLKMKQSMNSFAFEENFR
jgi:hypothetical protein